MSDFVSFHILFNHPTKLYYFVSLFFLLVLNLPGYLQWLMVRTENQISQLFQIKLLHIDLFLPRTFRMIVFIAHRLLTLDTGSCSVLSTNIAFKLESFLIDSFYSFNVNLPVFLFKETFWNPDCAYIMAPDIVALWPKIWIVGRPLEIVVVEIILLVFIF
mgnify:CR=1 FL=1